MSLFIHQGIRAHILDNVCIESLSIDLTRPMLESAARSVNKIADKIEEIKRTDAGKLQDEYEKLVAGLQEANDNREDEDMMNSPGERSDSSLCARIKS